MGPLALLGLGRSIFSDEGGGNPVSNVIGKGVGLISSIFGGKGGGLFGPPQPPGGSWLLQNSTQINQVATGAFDSVTGLNKIF